MPGFVGVHRNPTRWQAVVQQREVRHSTAGCLLSVLLFAPLFVRQYGLCAVCVVCAVYAVVIVPAAAGYISLTALAARTIRLLQGVRALPAGARRPYTAPVPLLALLLGVPFVALLLRPHTEVLRAAGAGYCLLLVPLALKGQLPTSFAEERRSLSGVVRAVHRLLRVLWGAVWWSASTALLLLRTALLLPCCCMLHAAHLLCCAAAALHRTLLQCTAAVRCLQQLLFFVHLEHLLLPAKQLQLTALVHLLSYNICLYICSRLSTSGLAAAHSNQSAAALGPAHTPHIQSAASFTAAKLGKAVVLCIVLNASWARYVDLNLWFSVPSAAYFLLTTLRCEPPSLLVLWALPLDAVQLGEDVLSLVVTVAPPAASLLLLGTCLWGRACALPPLRDTSWWQVAGVMATLLAIYTNVLLPLQLLRHDCATCRQLDGYQLCRFRRAGVQDCRRQGTCAVCLERLGSGRVTVCRHVYHDTCLRGLIVSGHTRCPLCNAAL